MREVTIPLEQFTELLGKAIRFDILKTKDPGNKYLTTDERAIFGFEQPEPPKGTVAPVEDDF